MTKQYELSDSSVVVVIGSGAGGATVANELAQKGIDVVCFEAGKRLTLADVENSPPAMDAKMGWHDKRLGSMAWICKTVGGTTMRWSAVTPRIQEHEFKALTSYGQLDGCSIIDWPITLAELEPYYVKAEDKMGVSGTGDIPHSAETNNFKVMKAGAENVGYKEITTAHTAINPVARKGRPGCQQIGFCNSGCAIGAKWSTLYTEVPAAEMTGHFELRAQAMAVKINHDKSGRVTGVVYTDASGNQQEQKARAVCVAGNVVETARILLNSDSSLFPHGLGNASDQVGRNYTRHMFNITNAVMPHPVNYHRGTRQSGIVLDEQYHKPERGFAGGYIMETLGLDPWNLSNILGGWGHDHTAFTDKYTHIAGAFVTGDLFNLYVCFEVLLTASFILLALGGERPQLEGSIKYVALNLLSSALFLAGVGILYGMAGTLNMAELAIVVQQGERGGLVTMVAVMFMMAFGIKAGMFPLYFWLPASYPTPPIAVTALFSGLLTKVGVYALIRVFTLIFCTDPEFLHTLILIGAGLTMLSGVLAAASHYEMRKILSVHIVSQIGYIVMGLGLFTELALAGTVIYLIHIIIVKTNLFLVAGAVNRLKGTYDLHKLGGLYKERPGLSILFIISAMSLAGIPPLSGFFAKLTLIIAGLQQEAWLIITVALVVSLLTLYSMTKIWAYVFWKPAPNELPDLNPMAPVAWFTFLLPMIAFTAITIGIGIFAGPIFDYAQAAAGQLMNPQTYIQAVLGGGV